MSCSLGQDANFPFPTPPASRPFKGMLGALTVCQGYPRRAGKGAQPVGTARCQPHLADALNNESAPGSRVTGSHFTPQGLLRGQQGTAGQESARPALGSFSTPHTGNASSGLNASRRLEGALDRDLEWDVHLKPTSQAEADRSL